MENNENEEQRQEMEEVEQNKINLFKIVKSRMVIKSFSWFVLLANGLVMLDFLYFQIAGKAMIPLNSTTVYLSAFSSLIGGLVLAILVILKGNEIVDEEQDEEEAEEEEDAEEEN